MQSRTRIYLPKTGRTSYKSPSILPASFNAVGDVDAELIEIGKKFEPMSFAWERSVRTYFEAETHEEGPAKVEYERLVAAHGQLDIEIEAMLSRIAALPALSPAGLRVKTMVAMWKFDGSPLQVAKQQWSGIPNSGEGNSHEALPLADQCTASIWRDLARVLDLVEYARTICELRMSNSHLSHLLSH